MGLYVSLPTINEKHVESIKDDVFQAASEFFDPDSDYYEGACFAEEGPSMKELREHMEEGQSDRWWQWHIYDVMDDHEENAKEAFKENGVWHCNITEANLERYNDSISMITSDIEWKLAESLYDYLKKNVHVPTEDELKVKELEEDYEREFNAVNDDENWRDRYFDDERWVLNNVDLTWCYVCDDDTPHFEHTVYDKLMIQVGCRANICAVCGDGSV